MANNPSPQSWGIIAAAIVGLGWLLLGPELVYEEVDDNPVSQSRQISLNPLSKPAGSKEASFDFYVLALSWSPSYCASKNSTSGPQCDGKRFYSFVVHGLWPQYEKGWPSNCDASAVKVPSYIARPMLDIMPGYGLIAHQWRKHGTCSGLRQKNYFAKLRSAYDRIRFPAHLRLNDKYLMVSPKEVENAFRIENPQLAADAIAVTCDKRRLREVRICFSKALEFRACPQVDRNACRKKTITLPPVRGTG